MTALTLTIIGRDRPGLVRALAERVAVVGGNWLESRMARLAGQFAGILLVEVPAEEVDRLIQDLRGLDEHGLHVTVERGAAEEAPTRAYRSLVLDLIGQDRPGIVREIAQALASQGVNIDELTTTVQSGFFSAESMFHATARLRVPEEVDTEALRGLLEPLANELMVDISLEPPPEA
jgi:glycine cleavage system regulatory protein